ncbi:hypothetical protein PR048_013522 [Dryococelus australis]|uniref:Uncharacterized protein n=1 Tax=Dryococelus australis TaxID=614101 RepID=A0ABQ9HSF7_9NEOP|nr:hypothetical protein PR048_013522 [Dryococelus australis]
MELWSYRAIVSEENDSVTGMGLIEVLRVDDGEARYGAAPECKSGENGRSRENPLNSGIAQQDFHMRKSGVSLTREYISVHLAGRRICEELQRRNYMAIPLLWVYSSLIGCARLWNGLGYDLIRRAGKYTISARVPAERRLPNDDWRTTFQHVAYMLLTCAAIVHRMSSCFTSIVFSILCSCRGFHSQTTHRPSRQTGFESRWGGSQIFVHGNRVGRCHWSASFLWDLLFPRPLHYAAAPYAPRFTLIGYQDLDPPDVTASIMDSVPPYTAAVFSTAPISIWHGTTQSTSVVSAVGVGAGCEKETESRGISWLLGETKTPGNFLALGHMDRVQNLCQINQGWRETEDPPENTLIIAIVRHDSHMRKSGSGPAGNRARITLADKWASRDTLLEAPEQPRKQYVVKLSRRGQEDPEISLARVTVPNATSMPLRYAIVQRMRCERSTLDSLARASETRCLLLASRSSRSQLDSLARACEVLTFWLVSRCERSVLDSLARACEMYSLLLERRCIVSEEDSSARRRTDSENKTRAAYGANHVTAPRGYLPVQPDRGPAHVTDPSHEIGLSSRCLTNCSTMRTTSATRMIVSPAKCAPCSGLASAKPRRPPLHPPIRHQAIRRRPAEDTPGSTPLLLLSSPPPPLPIHTSPCLLTNTSFHTDLAQQACLKLFPPRSGFVASDLLRIVLFYICSVFGYSRGNSSAIYFFGSCTSSALDFFRHDADSTTDFFRRVTYSSAAIRDIRHDVDSAIYVFGWAAYSSSAIDDFNNGLSRERLGMVDLSSAEQKDSTGLNLRQETAIMHGEVEGQGHKSKVMVGLKGHLHTIWMQDG